MAMPQTAGNTVYPLQFFESLGLIQLQSAKLSSPAV